ASSYGHPITTNSVYDGLNRRTALTEAAGTAEQRLTTTVYDAANNLQSVTTGQSTNPAYAHPVTTTFTYDALNRRTAMTEAAGRPEQRLKTMVYDAANNALPTPPSSYPTPSYGHAVPTDSAYDALSRRTAMTEAAGQFEQRLTTMLYDVADN